MFASSKAADLNYVSASRSTVPSRPLQQEVPFTITIRFGAYHKIAVPLYWWPIRDLTPHEHSMLTTYEALIGLDLFPDPSLLYLSGMPKRLPDRTLTLATVTHIRSFLLVLSDPN
jgi:hypothetical protein